MCAGFGSELTSQQLALYFSLPEAVPEVEPNPGVRPTDQVAVVLDAGEGRRLELHRWWLIPAWWRNDPKALPSLFNARSEGIAEKPSFRSAFRSRRCLIPASCFYEWAMTPGGRQKFVIRRTDRQPLAFAGLWEEWRPAEGEPLRSCTIITTTANDVMSAIHTRMPVILDAADWDAWLDAQTPLEVVHSLLRPCPNDWIAATPVSTGQQRLALDCY
jgi:putative SOS response-associated peptidase YedK